MEVELTSRAVPFRPKHALHIAYKGRLLKKEYIADLYCYGLIIVELKAMVKLTTREEAQLLNYLKATGAPVGLLINFGSIGRLEWRRFVGPKEHDPRRNTKEHEEGKSKEQEEENTKESVGS